MRKALTIVLACAGVLAAGAQAAGAATTADCQAKIADLRSATQSATFTGRNAAKDQSGLIEKLDAAALALSTGKNADAVQKLGDFRAKVLQLDEAGKIVGADADRLVAGADDAIACIEGTGT